MNLPSLCLMVFPFVILLLCPLERAEGTRDEQQLSNFFSVESFTPPVIVFRDPSYLVLCPKSILAGEKYKLVVNILPPSPSVIVKVSIFRDNIQLDSQEQLCENFEPQILELKVPSSSSFGKYRLRIEGNQLGWLTGTAFTDEAVLQFNPKTSAMAIQTDRPIYKQGSLVKFRVIVVDPSAKLIDDSVDVLILTPKGVLVHRWLSRQCLDGTIDLEFPLSENAEEGKWTIRVEAANSVVEQNFLMEHFYQPRFEVRVETPSFVGSEEDVLRGTIYANYSCGAPVSGNVTVRAALKPFFSEALSIFGPQADLIQDKNQFSGVYRFKFRLSDLDYLLDPSEGGEMVITATVGDSHLGSTQTGHSVTRIFNSHINLRFLGESPLILRPSMPLRFFLAASLQDGSHVPSYRLARHRLLLTPEVFFRSGDSRRFYSRSIKMTHDQYGLWDDELDLHSELSAFENMEDVSSIKLEAELKDSFGKKSFASLVAVTFHSKDKRYIQVTTSSNNPKVGENAIFHVRSNFYLDKFCYVILTKGLIIDGGQETMEASLKTFPIALTSQMAGQAVLVIYALERGREIVADSLTFPVDGLSTDNLEVHVQEMSFKNQLKVIVKGKPGSRVSLTGSFWDIYKISGINDFSKAELLKQLSGGSSDHQNILQQKWISHKGLPEDLVRMPQSSFGADVNQTFSYSGLMILSDGDVPFRRTPCRSSRGFHSCLLGGCFTSSSTCDKKWDCLDRIDEMFCAENPIKAQENLMSFRIIRQSRWSNHLTPPWLWTDLKLNKNGTATISVTCPERNAKLVLSAFSVSKDKEISFLKDSVLIKTTPPHWIEVEAPSRVGIWEQIGLKVTIINQMNRNLPAEFSLAQSPHYQFVSLKEFQEAQPQNQFHGRHPNAVKRDVSNGHKYSVLIPAGESRSFHLPIVLVSTGKVLITVQATFPGLKTLKTTAIFVEPMGAVQELHTSFLMNLNNRAYLFRFLDVQIPQGEHLQMPEAHISIFGDTVGGSTSNPVVVPEEALNLPMLGSESIAFSLLVTLNQLKQWKKLDQKPPKDDKEVFGQLSLLYQSLLSYQNDDGGFQLQRTGQFSSVWVTSLVLKCLNVIASDWSHFLYIDPQITDKALNFILRQQAPHGAFWEPSGLTGIRPLESFSNSVFSQLSTRGLNLSITALTLIHLHNFKQLSEPLNLKFAKALDQGKSWLEDNLELVEEASKPLEVTLVGLALHLARSNKAEHSFAILARNARQENFESKVEIKNPFHTIYVGKIYKGEQYVYWGEDLVPLPSYRVEDNRPFLQPKQLHAHDSGNVAATAAALRVYADRREVLTPAIAQWLQSQRAHHGGWMSTFDTLLAWEALSVYSDNENRAKITRLTVTVEPMVPLSQARVFYITPSNLLHLQTQQLGPTLGSVTVQGKGKGSAILQLNVKYYVTDSRYLKAPPVKAFSLVTDAIASGHNASSMTFRSCVSWLYTSNSDSSGISVLDVTVPTGYGISLDTLHEYVQSGKVPALRSATFRPRLISFFFDKLGQSNTCVEFTLDRWFPAANLTTVLPVKIYEYYSPELFALELLDMSSITLDICQVCGSYECSNCPVLSYYSSSSGTRLGNFTNLYSILSSLSITIIFSSFSIRFSNCFFIDIR